MQSMAISTIVASLLPLPGKAVVSLHKTSKAADSIGIFQMSSVFLPKQSAVGVLIDGMHSYSRDWMPLIASA